MRYEYKVVPAPTKPQKAPRVKGAEAKFAFGLEKVMNTYAEDGWEYQRADILPSEERRGLRSSQTVYRTVLVFRRAIEEATAAPEATPMRVLTDDARAPEPPAAPDISDTSEHPEAAEVSEAEHVTEAERRSRFSLVGPARRNQEAPAPPLAAPHVIDETRSERDTSEDGR
ncbi:MAG: DUF4177 domain-containing protein [Pseudomonadota bacterium]